MNGRKNDLPRWEAKESQNKERKTNKPKGPIVIELGPLGGSLKSPT